MRSRYKILYAGCLFFSALALTSSTLAQYPGLDDPGARSSGATGEGLAPVAPQVDGGTIPIGATAQVVLLFKNDGGRPVETGTIRLYPSSTVSSAVSLNQCEEEPLPSGAECAIALSVKGLQPGPWRIEMLMSHNGRSRLVTSTISGSVEAAEGAGENLTSDIEMIPSELDFGSLSSSQTLVEPIILRNVTSTPIKISNLYIDASEQAGYSLKGECEELAAGQSCIATVTWSPKLKGRSSGVLVAKHSGPAGLSSVPLKGEYAPEAVNEAETFPQAVPGKGLLVSSQKEVDFGGDINTTSTITVSLVNSGDAPLTIEDIKVSGSDNGVSYKTEGCAGGDILEPIEACPLTISWSPTRVGELLDDIQILHDGARGVLVLPVRGSAVSTVSQDQKAIVLSDPSAVILSSDETPEPSQSAQQAGVPSSQQEAAARNAALAYNGSTGATSNPVGTLDGYKITSFSPTRAIINGPGGSRIVFHNEESVLGGVPWMTLIKADGIEFVHKKHRVLLLFDRSLSSINRVVASSSTNSSSGGDAESSVQ
ncbi:MAG: choice-of-anchor D domain-containing protein [Alphaproteobacteria bacterium]|nr:choice-of-anchor D domain-containing protein [Alphaproteobacteria bacterium]